MNSPFKNHKFWQEIAEMLTKFDVNALGREHLEDCHYTISGYWDENDFYQEITFGCPISAELVIPISCEDAPNLNAGSLT